MDDSPVVRFLQRLGDLASDRRGLRFAERPFRDLLRDGLPRDVLHDEEIHALLPAEVVDRRDVGMIELGERERFPAKALPGGIVGKSARGQHLERDVAAQALVPRAVHHAHAARADLLHDAIMGQRFSDHDPSL